MNEAIFKLIHSLVGSSPTLDHLMIFMAKGGLFVLGLIVLAVFWHHQSKEIHRAFARLIAGTIAVYAFQYALKLIVAAPRPFVALNFMPLINEPADFSFPSGHATLAFCLAGGVYWVFKNQHRWLNYSLLFFAALIALARVYVGVHWPLDIIAGAALGLGAIKLVLWNFKA